MIKQICFGLFIGLVITILAVQRNEWVHHQLEHAIHQLFLESMQCDVSCKVSRLNFFVPTLELVEVKVNPVPLDTIFSHQDAQKSLRANGEENFANKKNLMNDDPSSPFVLSAETERSEDSVYRRIEGSSSWSWSAKRYITGFSWLDLIFNKKLNLWVQMHDLDATSAMEGTDIAIVPHIQTLLNEVAIDIPTSISSLSIKHGTINFFDLKEQRNISLHVHGLMEQIKNDQKIHLSCISGSMSQRGTLYADALGGTINCTLRDDDLVSLSTDLNMIAPYLNAQSPIFCVGSWQNKTGSWHIYDSEHKVDVQCTIDAALNIDGEIKLQKLAYRNYPYLLNGAISICKREELWAGTLAAQVNDQAQFTGSWQYDHEADMGHAQCMNKTPLSLANISYWRLLADSIQLDLKREPGKFSISYSGIATHDLLATTNRVQGEVIVADGTATVNGSYNDETYRATFGSQMPYLIDAEFIDVQGTPHMQCTRADESMECALEFSFVRKLIKRLYGYDLQGKGSLELKLTHDGSQWTGSVHLIDGTIRLPETYNFINGLDARFAFHEDSKWLSIEDLACTMHAGRVRCSHGAVQFDDHFTPIFIHAPISLEQCMLNFRKDLFALVSGSVTIGKSNGTTPSLAGNLFIERAQLKENLLSAEFHKQLGAYSSNMLTSHAPDVHCDLTIETMHPIRIDTNVLKTNAAVHLAIQNNLNDIQVSGAIRLIGGTLEFPYKPLNITEGIMYLQPGQLYNPLVELRAKNTIKNHTISLQVTGSLASHHIMFDATPPLSEEQIIALLLVGSHEESLATMAPALLMQNLKHALFGINEPTIFEKYMHKLAKPLNIHLVPSFTDQTGRGGLRGALEIDVNDRWRAMIQKNFTLTEDTRFELDYLLSDDITIRAIRDERRDVGGEVEVKWSF